MTQRYFSVVGVVCLVAVCAFAPHAQAQVSSPTVATAGSAAFFGPPPPQPPAVIARGREGLTIRAVRLTTPLDLDGRLDDEIYGTTPAFGDFIQNDPREGEPATEKTDMWVFFDNENVYFAARCWDSQPTRAVANEKRRDNQGIQNGDNLAISLDTFYDRRNGYFFQTNPVGALRDQQVTDEGNTNPDWNAVWDAKVSRDDKGWTVEMVFPFKSLRYKAAGSQVWGFNARRIVKWKNEQSYLAPVPAAVAGQGLFRFSMAATLVGIEVPAVSRNFELKPYVKTGLATNIRTNPPLSNDLTGDVGIDLKYGLTKGLTADLTVNTDFAQVEEDEQQVNLTRFSLLFPEKRDFFLEGQGIFAFGGVRQRAMGGGGGYAPILFFSRNIGISNGQEVPIRAGGRVTGRTGKYTVGLLNIGTGASTTAKAEATNFSVVRVKRDILRRSAIGVLATQRPRISGDGYNQVYGADAALAFYQNITINAYYARSRTSDAGGGDQSSYFTRFDYGADRYGLSLEHLTLGEDFNPELGFVRRPDMRRSFAQARFSPRTRQSKLTRKLTWEANLDYITNPTGRLESREVQGSFEAEFNTGDTASAEYSQLYELLVRPFTVAPGVVVPAGQYPFDEARLSYNLGQQHRVSGSVDVSRGSFYTGDRTSAGYNGRINLGGTLGIEPRVTINWIDLPQGSFTSKVVSTRVSLTLTPRMALTSLFQYNSGSSALSSNIRFRWEYRPGSDLFVVYSDGRNTSLSGFPTLENRSFVVKATRLMRW